MGIGYEFLMIAGKHDNAVTRFLSAPGLWMQRLTTKEPDEKQLECAIVALKCALSEEFPDFDKTPYINKGRKSSENGVETPAEAPAETSEEAPAEPEA